MKNCTCEPTEINATGTMVNGKCVRLLCRKCKAWKILKGHQRDKILSEANKWTLENKERG